MLQVKIDSVRVSLMSQHRLIVLKEIFGDRYLPIWIGPFEADAITLALQGVQVARPLTHDLLQNVLQALGARVEYVVVTELTDDTFYANIVLDVDDEEVIIDSRPSDAIALAVRVDAPIFVEEDVMDEAGILPDPDITETGGEEPESAEFLESSLGEGTEEDLGVFKDFLSTLNFGDLPSEEDE